MSYEITLEGIPEEEMKQYQTIKGSNRIFITTIKYEIIESCLRYKDKFESGLHNYVGTIQMYIDTLVHDSELRAISDMYNQYIEDTTYNPKGNITIVGRRFDDRTIEDGDEYYQDSIKDYCLENLFKLGALVDTPDYWEDSERWQDMYNEVNEIVDYCIDESYNNAVCKFINKYYQYSDEYKEKNKE